MRRRCSPLTFLLTGFAWLTLSSFVGLALLVGLVRSSSLPAWLPLVHVHAALVGGVAQMILGAFLVFIPPLLMTGHKQEPSYPWLFAMINGGTIGMLAGFALKQRPLVGAAGFLVLAAFLWLARDAWTQARRSLNTPPLNFWFYCFALLALFGGLACGEAMTFNLWDLSPAHLRLAHIHLNLLGFIALTIVGTMHNLLPTVLNAPLYSPRLARAVFVLLPLGIAALAGGFLGSSIMTELVAGGILLVGSTLYATNLFRTWQSSQQNGSAASDHLMIGTFFFLLTIVLGILVAADNLVHPPFVPYGSLHLMAYTHMTLVGLILHTIMGALSHLIPITLAVSRVPNAKKRGPYLDRLTAIINRWRTIQIVGLSLGTMGLAFLASLTWNMPLSSPAVQLTAWISFGLLLSGLTAFVIKLVTLLRTQPEEPEGSPA